MAGYNAMFKHKKIIIGSILGSAFIWLIIFSAVLSAFTTKKFFVSKQYSDSMDENSTTVDESLPVSANVMNYKDIILQYAQRDGIAEYINLILALLMQETGGNTTQSQDIFQCAESLGIPRSQMTLELSISHGVQVIADRIKAAGVTSPSDIAHIKLALQGYNFGPAYITYALANGGGWSQENVDAFAEEYSHGRQNSKNRAKILGKWRYGDQHYTDHVLRYYVYSDSGIDSGSLVTGNNKIVDYAKGLIGKPYEWGAAGPNSFDCSGLVYYVFKQTGVYNGQRLTASGYKSVAKEVKKKDAKAGDLVFFRNSRGIHHIAIYVGNNQVIHAPKPGKTVSLVKIWRTTDDITYGRLGD